MRGPIAPPQVPLSVTRAEAFVDLVYDSRDRLERRWPQLSQVDFLILEVPGFGPDDGRTRPPTRRPCRWGGCCRPRADIATGS